LLTGTGLGLGEFDSLSEDLANELIAFSSSQNVIEVDFWFHSID
jgi:hypothetical protein